MLQCWFWQLVLFYRRCSFGLMDFFLHFLPGYPRILHLFPTSLSNIKFVNCFPSLQGTHILSFYFAAEFFALVCSFSLIYGLLAPSPVLGASYL